jgi:hypothetical protein
MPVENGSNIGKKRTRLLRDFYNQLARFEYVNPARARQLLDEPLELIDEFTGSPDLWHNTAMVASRLNYPRRVEIIRAGLDEWPDDVDLLCDDLQFCYGSEYDPVRAQEIWTKLASMDEAKTGPFWRFWVYGAIYHAKLGKVQEGVDLLDRGILSVKRDSLMDVFRGYRNVLVDHIPQRALVNDDELVALHKDILQTLEAKLSLGIRLGIENGYVLALELARLYQEMAGADFFSNSGKVEPGEIQTRVNDKLRRALEILHLAECLYTADPNHPIQEIYERRINLLMPLHEYDEALKLLHSIPSSSRRLEETRIARDAMRRFATLKTGGSLEPEGETTGTEATDVESALQVVVPILFSNNGEGLERYARATPEIRQTILRVAASLSTS